MSSLDITGDPGGLRSKDDESSITTALAPVDYE